MAFSPTGLMSFKEFIDFKPNDKVYELYDGIASEMQPVGQHEEIVGFLTVNIAIEIGRLALPYLLPKQALIKVPSQAKSLAFETESAYCPDVLVVKRSALLEEPLWSSTSTLAKGSSLALVVEVVSTNWRIDYGNKLNDYESLGISEYWIIDYLPLAGKRVIGEPRVPTVSVYRLVDDEFVLERFQGNALIVSDVFPEINLTANQVFNAIR
ncbi:MAG: Uma2 family endonuclease [Anaerolineae bacterium]|nr:Uma2 family endonuclease [Gloeobacterales cyanobacterium ES-bin-313]